MSRLGKYWIFFVIVAVGLALSWGQVGRKAERVLQEDPVVYLVVEPGCAPARTPCAAVARDRALVLGPGADGLLLRQTGFDADGIIRVEVQWLAPDGTLVGERQLDAKNGNWLIRDFAEASGSLRVRVVGNHDVTVADFPN